MAEWKLSLGQVLAVATAVFAALVVSGEARPVQGADRYGSHTDEELTQIAGRWESLSTDERRAFFTEMRRRMADKGKQPIAVHAERRFGRVVRQPDGSLVRIEGVVRYRPLEEGYGTGFEQRAGDEPTAPTSAPAVTVKNR